MIGIIDFGLGNLGSILNSFEDINCKAKILKSCEEIRTINHLILPGVGSFRVGMQNLIQNGWDKYIFEHTKKKKPLLGICLGMQLLFDWGTEDGGYKGLGYIKGKVDKMEIIEKRKLPHVGWNKLNFLKKHPIFKDVKEHVDYYFVHSYECISQNELNIISKTEYEKEFISCVSNGDSIVGTQFHPEKSPPNGLKILKNFSQWDGRC
jgi:glutamine amidotransferase